MDRTTKLFMAVIAAGLFANVAVHTVKPAHADDETDGRTLGQIATELGDIKHFIARAYRRHVSKQKALLNYPECRAGQVACRSSSSSATKTATTAPLPHSAIAALVRYRGLVAAEN
jgi:hypothetical protein